MQLSQSLLLASFFLFLSLAGATPLNLQRSPRKFFNLPVKRHRYDPPDLHPRIVTEQIVNRALQRLARMSGSPAIPREILERNLMRRVLEVEGQAGLERRFNRRSLDNTVKLDKRLNLYHGHDSIAGSLAVGNGDSIKEAKPPTAENSLGLAIEGQDVAYLATVAIGTPPRDFTILMDSGSSDFWVGSEDCTSLGNLGCGNHIFLGSKSSSSFEDTGRLWSITYGSGSVSGSIVSDKVNIANLTLSSLSFGVANTESQEFSDSGFDGLMGLGGSKLSNQKNIIPIMALAQENKIDTIVSYKLGRSSDKINDGEITFGALDPSKFDDKTLVTFQNLTPDLFWTASLTDVKVDNKSKVDNTSLGIRRPAILDTGTTLVLLPEDDAVNLHNRIPGARFDPEQDFFIIPCDTDTVVSLTFGGRDFDINPVDLSFAPTGENGECLSGFKPSSQFPNKWLIGDVFLKSVYFSTNFGTNQMSLAELA